MTDEAKITWEEFGEEVKKILTPDQIEKIRALHDRMPAARSGCAAHDEGADCCVESMWLV